MSALIKWTKVANDFEELGLASDGLKEIVVDDRKFCVARVKGQLFAVSATCPHAGGRLAGGYVDATGNIVCPIHRYKFSLKNGYNSSGEGYHLKTFPIEHREDGIFLGLATGGL